jgi:hypothetical protein
MKPKLPVLLGTCAGVLAGLTLAHLISAPPIAAPAQAGAAAPEARTQATAALESPAARLESAEAAAPRREPAAPAPARMSILEALAKAGPVRADVIQRLPSLKRCLLDPELNPEGRSCADEAQRTQLEQFISAKNQELAQLEQQHTGLVDTFLAAKMEAGVDPPAVWKTIPESELLLQCQVSMGADKLLGTVLRRGENPEIEQLEKQIDAAHAVARSELRERITQIAPR